MKVVLFCGGLGLRMREASERIPKPMVPIGTRPVIWHVMKYFSHYGHKDFILCLGHKAEVIKRYFLDYEETISNDFVLHGATKDVELLQSDISDWRITFVNTGLKASVGERLKAVQPYLEGEERFLANYGDTLTDAHLPTLIDRLNATDKLAGFLCVRPSYTFHVATIGDDSSIENLEDVTSSDVWINGGYFVFRQEFMDYLQEGEDLVDGALQRLIRERGLLGFKHTGFWAPMDTLRDQQELEQRWERGEAPWSVWAGQSLAYVNGHAALQGR
ncbi:MAG: sugar phosphate nucleotidyltransferase [Thermoleophilia bacterium]